MSNQFNGSFTELRNMEQQLFAAIKDLGDRLSQMVSETNLPGVTVKKDSPVQCCTVSAAALCSSDRLILSPDYYLPQAQADAVRARVSSCKSASQLCAVVKEMLDTKRIRRTPMAGNTVDLNPETLRVLAESDIGKYVMSAEYTP